MKKGMMFGLALAAVILFSGLAFADNIYVSYGDLHHHHHHHHGHAWGPVVQTTTTYVNTTPSYTHETYVTYGPVYHSYVSYGPVYSSTSVTYSSSSFDLDW